MEVARSMMIRIITVFTWSLVIPAYHTASLSFNYTNFYKCSEYSIKLFGTATCEDSGVQLTSSDFYITGQAHYSKPIRLWDASTSNQTSFNTTFTFSMNKNNGSYTFEGLAFFIASFNYTFPGSSGADGLLGLVDGMNMLNPKRISSFVAVEFDTHYNSDWDTLSDNHVGIDINSLKSVASKRWRSYANGTTMSANISYKDKNLCVEFMGLTESSSDVPGDTLCYNVNLKDYLTEWAVLGFSASTSYSYQSHTLKTWSFSSDLDLEGVPNIVKSEVNKSNTTKTGKKTNNKSLMIGLPVGIIGLLAILILAGLTIRARSNRRPGGDLRSDSGCRSPDGFLATRSDRSSVVKMTR